MARRQPELTCSNKSVQIAVFVFLAWLMASITCCNASFFLYGFFGRGTSEDLYF